MEDIKHSEYPKVVYFRPDGAQGVRINVEIASAEQDQELQGRLSSLPPETNAKKAIMQTVSKLGLKRIDT